MDNGLMCRWGAVLSGKFLSHKITSLKHARHKICAARNYTSC